VLEEAGWRDIGGRTQIDVSMCSPYGADLKFWKKSHTERGGEGKRKFSVCSIEKKLRDDGEVGEKKRWSPGETGDQNKRTAKLS